MMYEEILGALPKLDDAQLRNLNKIIVQQIKAGRRVQTAIAAQTIRVGGEYITMGLRLQHNGFRVTVIEKKQTKALVRMNGRMVLIPMNCLMAIPEAA